MILSSLLAVQPEQTSVRGLWVSAGTLSLDLGLESSCWRRLAELEKRCLCKLQGGPVSHHLSPCAVHRCARLCTASLYQRFPSHLVRWKLESRGPLCILVKAS